MKTYYFIMAINNSGFSNRVTITSMRFETDSKKKRHLTSKYLGISLKRLKIGKYIK